MRKQSLRYALSGAAGIVLAVALTIMVNWLGSRHYVSGDWTSSKMYSISDKTRGVLASLDEEIRVIVFMTPASSLYDQVYELLSRYAAESPKVQVEYIDPDKEPLKTTQLAEQFGITIADTVVFSYGDRTKYVTSEQMADYDYAGMQYGQAPTMQAFKGEEQITSAILSLVAPEVPKVYFVTGHGEASVSAGGGANDHRSLAAIQEALKRENVEVEDTTLLSGELPEDADVLAIVGPTAPFTEAEIELLGSWLDDGGRLLVALDPLIEPAGTMRPTRLEPFLADRGVTVNDDLVVDPSRKLPFYDLSAVYLTDFPSHPVTKGLDGIAVLFSVTRSLTVDPESDAVTLVETSPDGWGETNLAQLLAGEPVAMEDDDTAGPVAVGVAVAHEAEETPVEDEYADEPSQESGSRLLVFGDSDFMSDYEISNAGNLTLAMNAFNWLAAREQSLGIAARDIEQVSLFLSREQMRTILLVTLLVMPGAAIVAGILVWRKRRH
jgi:ABC-type uncharacterized transport system involved in gliding motility auxiliary subunit